MKTNENDTIMKWLRFTLSKIVKKFRTIKDVPVIHYETSMFSIPIEDAVFDFNTKTISALKSWLASKHNIELDKIIILTYTDISYTKGAAFHQSGSRTNLMVLFDGKLRTGILTVTNEINQR